MESPASPLVSVIVPTLNAARFLRDALASVDAQTYTPLEIIVIDGPSSDETPRIAQEFPRVRYLRQRGVGMWNALNEGFDAACGEFVAMISSDDLWRPDKVQMQVEYLREHPTVEYVFGLTKFVLLEGEQAPRAFRAELFEEPREAIVLEAMLARKTLLERVGKFDESFEVLADVDWFARLKNVNATRALLPHVVLQKRIHANNLSTAPKKGATIQHEMLTAMHAQLRRKRETRTNDVRT